MRSPKSPLVVFDLDGTLADTALDLVATLNAILVGDGVPALPAERARDKIGSGGRALLARGFEAAGREITPDHLEELYLTFLAHYGDNVCVHTRLYPGVIRALDRLEAEGFRFAVCTNKVESHARRLLEALGIAGRFGAICGRDTFPYLKPDLRHLTETIRKAGGDPRQAVMVGDSRTDVVTAKAAGIPVIAVSFGYSEIPVGELEPDRLIDHFDDLPAAVAALVRIAEPA
jgi:phosphoglycolate phosphatase